MSRATAAQREAQKAYDQQSIEKQIKKTQSGYMRNQKKTHKMILGKGSQHSLGAVLDSVLECRPALCVLHLPVRVSRLVDAATADSGSWTGFLVRDR